MRGRHHILWRTSQPKIIAQHERGDPPMVRAVVLPVRDLVLRCRAVVRPRLLWHHLARDSLAKRNAPARLVRQLSANHAARISRVRGRALGSGTSAHLEVVQVQDLGEWWTVRHPLQTRLLLVGNLDLDFEDGFGVDGSKAVNECQACR